MPRPTQCAKPIYCSDNTFERNNENYILLVNNGYLIECSSVYWGTCRIRNLDTLELENSCNQSAPIFQYNTGGQALLLNKNNLIVMTSVAEISSEAQNMDFLFILNLNANHVLSEFSYFTPLNQQDLRLKLKTDYSELARLNFKLRVINTFKSNNDQYVYFVYTYSTQGIQTLFTFLI